MTLHMSADDGDPKSYVFVPRVFGGHGRGAMFSFLFLTLGAQCQARGFATSHLTRTESVSLCGFFQIQAYCRTCNGFTDRLIDIFFDVLETIVI